ncbi:MAG: RNA-binding domain-containing protein [Candidatus Woesearchaeota archaeon]
MKLAHAVNLRTFIKPEDDYEADKQAFLGLIPFSLEDEKVPLQETDAKGFNERQIVILEVQLDKQRHVKAFLEKLQAELSGAQKQQLLEQDDRLDDECDFYLRFRKKDLPRLVLTDKGDCVHVRLSIAAFPKKRENAREAVKEIFK